MEERKRREAQSAAGETLRLCPRVPLATLVTTRVTLEPFQVLMQAVLERRCLFLVDGVDEAGGAKEEIERAIADELLDQGHKTIVTRRHSGCSAGIAVACAAKPATHATAPPTPPLLRHASEPAISDAAGAS